MKYNISYLTGRVLLYIAFFFVLYLLSFHVNANEKTEKIRAHDPVMIVQDDTFYLFTTGMGISVWSSKDMEQWQREESVFSSAPEWTTDAIPEFRGHMWAPDIFYYNDLYYLYYSVSSFGRNNSFIGVATNKTLHPESPDFQWIDQGPVIQSIPGRDLWNAIDPNVIIDKDQIPWMTFGSFWAGIKLFRLNEELTAPSEPQQWHTIAARERDFNTDDHRAGNAAIEAPFIFQKGKYYYLFVSYDHCCRGINSTYKIMVGRSEDITGPYIDKDGTDMAFGGASQVLEGNEDWPGVGHNAAYTFNGKDFLIFHGYDAHDEGRSKLLIREILWDEEDWPVVEL